MEPERSFPHSQQPATCPYSEPIIILLLLLLIFLHGLGRLTCSGIDALSSFHGASTIIIIIIIIIIRFCRFSDYGVPVTGVSRIFFFFYEELSKLDTRPTPTWKAMLSLFVRHLVQKVSCTASPIGRRHGYY
jgi:hypothetical protein